MEKVIVNALGEQCPIPVVKTNKALAEMKTGVLEVHVDNEAAVENVKRLALGKGLAVEIKTVDEKHFVLEIPVAESSTACPECEEILNQEQKVSGPTVVAVDTAIMGRGNDELGRTLMKGFIYAVSQLEKLPATILFYNGGAQLTTEGSDSLEDLKGMEARGVEILTCGTCLNYYGLSDKLSVGKVTNMYSIVEKLNQAGKVIKP